MWLRIINWFKSDHHALYVAIAALLIAWYFVDPSLNFLHVLYSAMWSNMWAPSIWTLSGILAADIRNDRRHKASKVHHVDTVDGLARQIDELTAKLVELTQGGSNDQ